MALNVIKKWIKQKIKSNLFYYRICIALYVKPRNMILNMFKKNKIFKGQFYSFDQFLHKVPKIKVLYQIAKRLSYSPPRFDDNIPVSAIFEDRVYTQYAMVLKNASFFGGANLILSSGKVLYDLPFYDKEHRFSYTDSRILKIEKNNLFFLKPRTIIRIGKSIWMGGNYSYNYYHVLYEFVIKFLLLETLNISTAIPIYIDQICFNIAQFKEIFDILNRKKYPLMAAHEDKSYMAEELY